MNAIASSREEILKGSRSLIQEQGWSAINIRSVAERCGVSVGSIYNYFSSKSELVCFTVESIWGDIFHDLGRMASFQDMRECIRWIYERMEYGDREYPDFFALHSMSFIDVEKEDARHLMHQTWQHILDGLCCVLQRDPNIRADAFDEAFTPHMFAELLLSLMIFALLQRRYDPTSALELVQRTLY